MFIFNTFQHIYCQQRMSINTNNNLTELQKTVFESMYEDAFNLKSKKEYVKAIESYIKIIQLKQDEVDCLECAKLYEDVGDIYYELKEYQQSFEYLQKANTVYSENNKVDLLLASYRKIGGLQLGIWQFKKAIDLFQEGLSLSTRTGNMTQIVEFELLLGNAYNWQDDFVNAEKYLLSALEKEKRINTPLIRLRAKVSFAILCRKMKKFEQAEALFIEGMEYSRLNNNAFQLDITKSYGIMQFDIGNYEKAEELLKSAEKQSQEEGFETTRAVILEHLYKLYYAKKDFERAYHYSVKFHERKIELLERGFSDANNILQAKIGLADAKRERIIAEESASAKSLFIATISHEIRTPMNIILGTTSLMLNDKPKKEHEKYLTTLKRSGENLLGIINDILDISKIEAGRLEIEIEPTDLHEVFDNIFNTMEQPANDKQLALTYKIDDKINFLIHSDPLRLTQIITNLISNSTKFTAKGSIHFEAKLKSKNKLEIIVRDTGIGIPKDKLSTIFDQYEQVRTKVQKKYKGTGLGLAISKKLVEMLNGTIQIKSKINEGTSFVIQLPFEKAAMQKNVDESVIKKDTSFLTKKTILIVDDLEDNRFILKQTLLFYNKDLNILEAENGLVAVDFCKKNKIDLVIMDLDMPEMNGFEALSEIRKNKKTKNLIVIASTASLITNGDDEFIEFGFDTYLPKPFEMEDLYNLLVRTLK